MKYTSVPEEKLFDLMTDGKYGFEIVKAEDGVSKAGNEMIILTVKVMSETGGERYFKDWIVAPKEGASPFKIFNLCKAVGRLDWYEEGFLEAANLPGLTGYLIMGTEKNDQGHAKNKIVKYLPKSTKISVGAVDPVPFNDDVPF